MDAALDRLATHVPAALWAAEGAPARRAAWVALAERAAARIAQWGPGCASCTVLVLDAGAGLLGAALGDAVEGAAEVVIVDERYFRGGEASKGGVDLGHLEGYHTAAKVRRRWRRWWWWCNVQCAVRALRHPLYPPPSPPSNHHHHHHHHGGEALGVPRRPAKRALGRRGGGQTTQTF